MAFSIIACLCFVNSLSLACHLCESWSLIISYTSIFTVACFAFYLQFCPCKFRKITLQFLIYKTETPDSGLHKETFVRIAINSIVKICVKQEKISSGGTRVEIRFVCLESIFGVVEGRKSVEY